MTGTSITARNAAGHAERRAKTRTPFNPPIYVDIEKANGGLAYNMTEDGIKISAAMVLHSDDHISMRIQLTGVAEWIETTGQIKWKSGSGKTAGIRFAGLTEETHELIRHWLAAERSKAEPQPEVELDSRPPQLLPGGAHARAPLFCLPSALTPLTPVKAGALADGLPLESTILADQLAGTEDECLPKSIQHHTGNATPGGASAHLCERRVHPRHQIRPVSYLEVDPDNRGMLLNISESGLAFIVTMRLAQNDLPTIRIQFADSMASLEVCGEIAWLSDSKREAGIRFVNLTEETRERIVSRISQEELPLKAKEKPFELPSACLIDQETPELPKLGILTPEDVSSDRVVSEYPQVPATSQFALPNTRQLETPFTAEELDAISPKSSRQIQFKSELTPLIGPMVASAGTKRVVGPAASLTLAAAIALAITGIATLPTVHVQRQKSSYVARNAPNTNKLNMENKPPSTSIAEVHDHISDNSVERPREFQRTLAEDRARDSKTHAAATLPGKRGAEHRAANPPVTNAIRQTQGALPENQTAKLNESAAISQPKQPLENSGSQVPSYSLNPEKENAPSPRPSSLAEVPSGTVTATAKEMESPPKPSVQPAAPATPTWLVVVSTDPYPSIRVSADTNSQKPSPGKNLRVGHAISSIEPVYPEDAKRQGIEGAVKLHVIVDRDGVVKKVELASGPALLAKAATRAIRKWRYSLTMVGGQPVETEQDVVVTFRLVSR